MDEEVVLPHGVQVLECCFVPDCQKAALMCVLQVLWDPSCRHHNAPELSN